MGLIRNILALLGAAAVAGMLYGTTILSEFDSGAVPMYKAFAGRLLESMDPGKAMVYSVQVNEDLTAEDVKESLKSLASAENFLFVGEAPFYKQVEAMTGEPYRHVTFLSFCDASVGQMMLEHNDVYAAFMPCRIALVEDKNGRLWMHTMALDMMIYGGRELPPELKSEAQRIWGIMQKIMQGAAEGEF
ncbi:MAG: DUF302 domain-containing protein [Magnetococcales bacterium]|nr:DUF302 domain-containing protein [Magnetococcales bacterium]